MFSKLLFLLVGMSTAVALWPTSQPVENYRFESQKECIPSNTSSVPAEQQPVVPVAFKQVGALPFPGCSGTIPSLLHLNGTDTAVGFTFPNVSLNYYNTYTNPPTGLPFHKYYGFIPGPLVVNGQTIPFVRVEFLAGLGTGRGCMLSVIYPYPLDRQAGSENLWDCGTNSFSPSIFAPPPTYKPSLPPTVTVQ